MQGLLFQKLTDEIRRGVAEGVFPGGQAAWFHREQRSDTAVGGDRCEGGPPVTPETLYDLASLTKLFTTAAALRLADRGALDLRRPIEEIVPALPGGSPWRQITVEQILAHETGLLAWRPYYEVLDPRFRGHAQGYDAMLELVYTEPKEGQGGDALYSDVGFIGLGDVLQRCTQTPLEHLVYNEVLRPLSLTSTDYRPLGQSRAVSTDCACTEACPWRGKVLDGEVHDDNAWAMGGVAGHAGLFGTASDVRNFGMAWLDALDGKGWLSPELAGRAMTVRPSGRGLGFDGKSQAGSAAGDNVGPRAVGHLGFTGTSLWIDPDSRTVVALLTNRVHPSRDNNAIRAFRPAFHNLFFGSI